MATEPKPIDLYEFLVESELQHYYNSIKNELKITLVSHLKYASDEDLKLLGLSRPEIRRLRKFYEKYFPHGYLSKIKRLLQTPIKKEDAAITTNSTVSDSVKVQSSPSKIPNNKHIIPADSISINKQLGTGEFGIVQQGVWTNGTERIQVAIKCLCRERMQSNPMEFLKEAAIMHSIENENIVRLYGVVLDADSLMLVTELAHLRSLLECLKDPGLRVSFLTVPTLCEFAMQICNGMMYLENKRLIHRDLAARNILVFSKNKVKISDFGLSRALGVGKDYYQTNFNVNLKLPIAWCAPECINYLRFTNASDVWAYGVCLWEMFSYGFQPWAALTGHQILEAIDEPNFQRLEQPECCPKEYYGLMLKCWQQDALKRPKFSDIYVLLPDMKPEQLKTICAYNETNIKDHLIYRQNDIITVLERVPNSIYWKGVLNSGKTGLFNPTNTVTYLGNALPSSINRDTFNRTSDRASTKRKLRTEMISRPQNDFKHTGHVGLDGAYFGDVAFLSNPQNYNQVPRQIVTPYKPSEDIEQTPLLLPATPTSPDSLQTASGYFPDNAVMTNPSSNPTVLSQNTNENNVYSNYQRNNNLLNQQQQLEALDIFNFSTINQAQPQQPVHHQHPNDEQIDQQHLPTNYNLLTNNPFINNENSNTLLGNIGTISCTNTANVNEDGGFKKNQKNIKWSDSTIINSGTTQNQHNNQHEYHEISDDDIPGEKVFDFGPSLLDEMDFMFRSMGGRSGGGGSGGGGGGGGGSGGGGGGGGSGGGGGGGGSGGSSSGSGDVTLAAGNNITHHEPEPKSPDFDNTNKKNEITELTSKLHHKTQNIVGVITGTHNKSKKHFDSVKPISHKDERILNQAISFANEISARSMSDLVSDGSQSAQSPKRKFSFRFPNLTQHHSNVNANGNSSTHSGITGNNTTIGSGGRNVSGVTGNNGSSTIGANYSSGGSGSSGRSINTDKDSDGNLINNGCGSNTLNSTNTATSYTANRNRNFSDELQNVSDLQNSITDDCRKAYNCLVEKPITKSHQIAQEIKMEQCFNVDKITKHHHNTLPRKLISNNRSESRIDSKTIGCGTTLPSSTNQLWSKTLPTRHNYNVSAMKSSSENESQNPLRILRDKNHPILKTKFKIDTSNNDNGINKTACIGGAGGNVDQLCESPSYLTNTNGYSFSMQHIMKHIGNNDENVNGSNHNNNNKVPLPPRDRNKSFPTNMKRHVRKHPLIIPTGSGLQRTINMMDNNNTLLTQSSTSSINTTSTSDKTKSSMIATDIECKKRSDESNYNRSTTKPSEITEKFKAFIDQNNQKYPSYVNQQDVNVLQEDGKNYTKHFIENNLPLTTLTIVTNKTTQKMSKTNQPATTITTAATSSAKPHSTALDRHYENIIFSQNNNNHNNADDDTASLHFESILESDVNKIGVMSSPDVTDGTFLFEDYPNNPNNFMTNTCTIDQNSIDLVDGIIMHNVCNSIADTNTSVNSNKNDFIEQKKHEFSQKYPKYNQPKNELIDNRLFNKIKDSVEMIMRNESPSLPANCGGIELQHEDTNNDNNMDNDENVSDVVRHISHKSYSAKTTQELDEAIDITNNDLQSVDMMVLNSAIENITTENEQTNLVKDLNSVSCEDLLEFSDNKPKGRERGIESDEVRIMSKVLGKKVAPEQCIIALEFINWDVHKAIKLLKLQEALSECDLSYQDCVDALQKYDWDYNTTYIKLNGY